jgi:protein phosphatase 1L
MEDFTCAEHSLLPPQAPHEAAVSFFGVFDGHNGAGAAQLACSLLPAHFRMQLARHAAPPDEASASASLSAAFLQADADIIAASDAAARRDGTTALVCLRFRDRLLVAHVGDSRGVACLGSGAAKRLTHDHTAGCPTEAARVRAAGGSVLFAGCWRVVSSAITPFSQASAAAASAAGRGGGGCIRAALAVTRALGDAAFKRPVVHVTADPDVCVLPLSEDLRFVLLASDGVWDVLSDQVAVDIALAAVRGREEGAEERARRMAEAVAHAALQRGSTDNATAMVLVPDW